jgi:hypothetical protein
MKKIILVLLMLTLSFSAFSQQKADYEDDGGIDQTLVLLTGVVLAIPRLHVDFFEMLADSFTKDHYIRTFSKTYPKARSQYNLCENRCQSPHGLLSLGFQKMQPAYGNLLDFLNEKKDFADHIQRTVGYCWGHTSTTRNSIILLSLIHSSDTKNFQDLRINPKKELILSIKLIE